jgi:hypothetical protein
MPDVNTGKYKLNADEKKPDDSFQTEIAVILISPYPVNIENLQFNFRVHPLPGTYCGIAHKKCFQNGYRHNVSSENKS